MCASYDNCTLTFQEIAILVSKVVLPFYTLNSNIWELVFKVLIFELFQKVEIGHKSFLQATDHVSEKSHCLIC